LQNLAFDALGQPQHVDRASTLVLVVCTGSN
jgi:hypothetical protein